MVDEKCGFQGVNLVKKVISSMNIAYVSVSHKPITAGSTGGIETFTQYLLPCLIKSGCKVSLFGASQTDMTLLPDVTLRPVFSVDELEKTIDENLESKSFTLNYALFQYAGVKQAIDDGFFDVIHVSQAQWYVPFLLGQKGAPIVTTVHVNNLRPKTMEYVLGKFAGPAVANISDWTGRAFGSYSNRRTIYNGIDVSEFHFIPSPKEYVAWLGRIAPVKGLKEAIIAAKKANVPFIASGSIDFPEYYEKEVKPLLDSDRKVIGPLNPSEKAAFLGNARAVLLPVQWDEPFGLVAVEAMACGTPVIAYKRGGLTDTIIDGATGYLVSDVDGMVAKIGAIDLIDRSVCRSHVEKNFSAVVMGKGYLRYYEDILNRKI